MARKDRSYGDDKFDHERAQGNQKLSRRLHNQQQRGTAGHVRNRLRNYHMIDWIDAQLEAYIYMCLRSGVILN
jgi:hypothetical protein